jgi:protein ImuB
MVVRCPQLCQPAESGRSASGAEASRPEARAAALLSEQVLAAVTRFCPGVEAVEPGVCAFGARGPARYFGGETVLARRIIAAVADLGAEPLIGVADGMFAALLAARGPDQVSVIPPDGSAAFLAGQPVSVLEDPDLAGLLSRLGLRTLGDLAALPAGDVAGRFGAAGETAHRLASGHGSMPLAVRPPAEDLSAACEFDPPEALAEPVVFAAKALAERMHDHLAGRGLTCVRVEVRAEWADGRESRRLWRHDGLLTAAGVADRVRWQLDAWQSAPLDAGPGSAEPGSGEPGPGGIRTLRLVPDQLVRATGHQLALWGEAVVSDQVARAAMRVQAMLGHEAVLRPVPSGGRNVGEQVTHVPFGEKREPRHPVGQPWPGRIVGAAPGVVYPRAREAEVTDDAGRAVTVTGRCALSAEPAHLTIDGEPVGRVTGWAGPWPLAERWWDPAAARRRARFQLLTGDGRAWLAAVQDGRWLIEAGYW